MLQHPLRTPPIRYTPSGLRLFYACSTVTLSGQIPEKCKLKYQLAKHTEQELQAGEGVHSSNSSGSGLIPQHKLC